MKKKTIRAPSRLIEDMKRFAYRAAENKFTPADIFNMACAYSQRIVINGVSIVAVDDVKVSSDDLFALSCAVFIHAYTTKYAYGLATKELMEQIKKIRNTANKNLVTAFWDTFKSLVGNTYKLITHTIYDVLFFWTTFPELFPIKIEDAVKFHRFSEYIAALNEECKCNSYRINLCDYKQVETNVIDSLDITRENIAKAADKVLKVEEYNTREKEKVKPDIKIIVGKEVGETTRVEEFEKKPEQAKSLISQCSALGLLILSP